MHNFNTSHVSINLILMVRTERREYNFNTSHVSINPKGVTLAPRRARISIHLMFLLIPSDLLKSSVWAFYFNTSHVSINRWKKEFFFVIFWDFNTSHVSINLVSVAPIRIIKNNFNTSHVSINPLVGKLDI